MKKNDLPADAFQTLVAISKELKSNEDLITSSKRRVEETISSIEDLLENAAVPDKRWVTTYFIFVFSEGLYWLSRSDLRNKEDIAFRNLCKLNPSWMEKKLILDEIRSMASDVYGSNSERTLSIAFHARDVLFSPFFVIKRS